MANELPENYRPGVIRRGVEWENFAYELQKKGVEKGYPTAGWPKKYGRLGYIWIEQAIQSEELAYWGTGHC